MVGSGWSMPISNQKIARPSPSREYLAVGPGRLTPAIPQSLPHGFDDLSKTLGYRAYEAMLTDPAVQSCYLGLKLSILDGGMQLMPAVQPPPERRAKAKQLTREPGKEADPKSALTPDEQLSQDVCDFCTWAVGRIPDFGTCLLQLLDAMAFGCKLAEATFEVMDDGPRKGKLAWKSIKVKPNWAWQFIVDSFMNIQGYLSYLPAIGQYVIVAPDKFCLYQWLPRNGDPRGTSILRAAYAAWNLKIQTFPWYYQHLCRWGSPGVDFEMAEGDTSPRIPVDQFGNPIPGAQPVDPVTFHLQNVTAYQGGSVLVHPAGSKVNVFEPKSPGEAFLLGFDFFDRQVCLAIELQTRATLEAKNGSKADSETAQDKRGPVVTWGRTSLASSVRFGLLKKLVELNFGKSAAEDHLPLVSFGKTEHQDRPNLWNAVASLARSGYIGESQKAELDADVGLPVRDAEADAKAEVEKAEMGPRGPKDGADDGQKGDDANNSKDGGKPQ